jgi:hypothetical protein
MTSSASVYVFVFVIMLALVAIRILVLTHSCHLFLFVLFIHVLYMTLHFTSSQACYTTMLWTTHHTTHRHQDAQQAFKFKRHDCAMVRLLFKHTVTRVDHLHCPLLKLLRTAAVQCICSVCNGATLAFAFCAVSMPLISPPMSFCDVHIHTTLHICRLQPLLL